MKPALLGGSLAILLLAAAQPASAQSASFTVCNQGTERISYATAATTARPFSNLFQAHATVKGWFHLEAGECHDVFRSFFGGRWAATLREGGTFWVGFLKRDGEGRRGTLLTDFDASTNFGPTDRVFCVDPVDAFERRGALDQMGQCKLSETLQPMGFSAYAFRPYQTNIDFRLNIHPGPGSRITLFEDPAERSARIAVDRDRRAEEAALRREENARALAEMAQRAEEQRRLRDEEERRQRAEADRAAFGRATATRALDAVQAYLQEFPDGTFIGQIRALHDELDEETFTTARAAHTHVAYESYLRDFPGGRHRTEASAAVDAFDDAAFQEAATRHATPEYQAYLGAFPRGRHVSRAQAALLELDRDAYDVARQGGGIAGYERYLEAHPRGRYAPQARELLDLHGQVQGLEREIAFQRSAVNHAEGRALFFGAGSLTSLAGAGALGYLAYGEYRAAVDLEEEMKGMDRGSDEYGLAKSDLSEATRAAVIYGVGALAGLYLARGASRKRTAQRAELEQERDTRRSRIDELLTARIALVPHLGRRGQARVGIELRF